MAKYTKYLISDMDVEIYQNALDLIRDVIQAGEGNETLRTAYMGLQSIIPQGIHDPEPTWDRRPWRGPEDAA